MDPDHDCCMIAKKPSQLGRLERQPDALVMVGLVVCYLGDELGPFKLNYLTSTHQLIDIKYTCYTMSNLYPSPKYFQNKKKQNLMEALVCFQISLRFPFFNQINHLSSHLFWKKMPLNIGELQPAVLPRHSKPGRFKGKDLMFMLGRLEESIER